ncbi:MAG: ABC transporter ATP-binding protein [Rhodothalassiaceae bacterium]
MALIRCSGLCKDYVLGTEVVHALAGIDVEIGEGEYVAVMGPSGSGKSTFMNLLGALDVPTAGSLEIAGTDIATLAPDELAQIRNRVIGFVFQQFNLLARATALQNVRLPLLYGGGPVPDWDERCRHALERVGLADRMHFLPNALSGGQQQRVAIARALVNDPKILLADEPTGALDSRTGAEILDLFGRLNAEGVTIIMVTHDAQVAGRAARRLEFLDGHLIRDSASSREDATALLAGAQA